jgi:hypothetical protein
MPSGTMMPARPVGREVLGHVIDKQHFAALGLDRKALVRLDAALGRHERRVGQDDVGKLVPALFLRQVSYSKMCGSVKPCR